MSKQGKRKITVELPKQKDLSNRPSVFERLGTKKASSAKKTTEHCRQWAQHGSCAYGKCCKFASTHTLISPSKQRAANKDSEQKRSVKDDPKSRLHSTVVVRPGHSPDGEIDNWDQNDLDYADADALEKRRLQLQRELELQLKMDGKDMRKSIKKPVSSTSSSRSSSSSSASSSSSDGSSSSSSSDRDTRRKLKKGKLKRNSSSSSDGDVPSKKKFIKSDTLKRDKSGIKKTIAKKDEISLKKTIATKKKTSSKSSIGKKSLSPAKKSGGTPPITSKTLTKNIAKHAKSPPRRERNRSTSPNSTRDRDKDRDRKEKEREKERDKDRTKPRSRSPRKARSRTPRPHKDSRRKESSERSRPVSPKKQVRKDGSSERHRKRTVSRDRGRDHKDRSLERRKEKNEEKERHDRKDRGRDRKDKRDDKRRGRGSGREGLGGSRGSDKGLEKPNKPMERLLPRPEERLAALAAISNRTVETDKNSTTSKDRTDTHSERCSRKADRERDRSTKRDRLDSLDREPGDYELDRQYDTDRVDHYDRGDDRYETTTRDGDRSPGYAIQARERHYDTGYDMAGPPRGYAEEDERLYGDRLGDRRGYDERRPHRDRSWEGRSSMGRERGYMHPHKEWDNEDYRAAGDWDRERRWPMHESQMNEWGDKDPEMEGWHHRGHPGHRGRMHENYGRGMRMDHKRRGAQRNEPPSVAEKQTPSPALPAVAIAPAPVRADPETEDKPIPDDLSEISDDPDDILNREDMADRNLDDDSQNGPLDDSIIKPEPAEHDSTQDTSGAAEEKDLKDMNDDEDTNLDFEEISDGELEEERTRAGLGDALGVDWASLVADVHRREQITPSGGARDRWRPEKVLTRVGLSIQMAGKELVQEILDKNAATDKNDPEQNQSPEKNGTEQNGIYKKEEEQQQLAPDVDSLHPVAAIQVAIEKRKRQRALLFGSGCEITRGLSARRDLALRRFLCHLPATERTGQSRITPQPSLFQAAKALLIQAKSG